MTDLPAHWATTALGTICGKGQYGWTTRAASEGSLKLLRTTDITKGAIDWTSVPYCQDAPSDIDKYVVKSGDILISRAGSVGFSTLIEAVPSPTVFASYLIRFVPSGMIVPRFVAYFLRTADYWRQISGAAAGIALSNVNASKLSGLDVPVAPFNEQKRIADKLDAVLARVDSCRKRLDRVPPILKLFRESVLTAAISGMLTEEWRERNSFGRSGSELIEELQKLHAKHASRSRAVRREQDKEHNADLVTDEEKVELHLASTPASWGLVRGAAIVEPGAEIVYGIVQPGPKLGAGIPYVRGMDIENGRILVAQLLRTSPEIAARYARAAIKGGDVLLGIIRATKVAIVPPELDGANITQGTARFRPSGAIRSAYLAIVLDAPAIQRWLQKHYRGIDMPGLNLADVRRVPIPLPPILEQEEIIRRVEVLLNFADNVKAKFGAACEQVEQLTPALLTKAFRAELVPQDLNDEPASVLLERIRRAADVAFTPKPKRRAAIRNEFMATLTPAAVKSHVQQMSTQHFTFDDLRKQLSTDYETLKDVLFTLLADPDSGFRQVFDSSAAAMHFVRTKP